MVTVWKKKTGETSFKTTVNRAYLYCIHGYHSIPFHSMTSRNKRSESTFHSTKIPVNCCCDCVCVLDCLFVCACVCDVSNLICAHIILKFNIWIFLNHFIKNCASHCEGRDGGLAVKAVAVYATRWWLYGRCMTFLLFAQVVSKKECNEIADRTLNERNMPPTVEQWRAFIRISSFHFSFFGFCFYVLISWYLQ